MQDVTSTPLPQLPPRAADSHKGTYGRVLIVGGSRGMAGAPALAGQAALRSGAGLVTVAVPRSVQGIVSSFEPSYMTLGLGETDSGCLTVVSRTEIEVAAKNKQVLALGPGLGTQADTVQLVCELYRSVALPMVVDADALNALAASSEILKHPGGPRILTPHPGEFQRLTSAACSSEPDRRAEQTVKLSQRDAGGQTVVVLKGHQTIVADSGRFAVNTTGNPGMATGGTGDCLTGVIAALVAQGLSPWEAARLGTHVHGLAGDLAAEQLGQVSLIASDLAACLPGAFQELE